MKSKRTIALILSALLIVLMPLLLPLSHGAAAQEAETTPEAAMTQDAESTIVCDRAVMLLVAIAVSQYGYQSSFDLAQFEKGEYQSLFEPASGGQGQQDSSTGAGSSSTSGGGEVTLSLGAQSNLPRYDGPDRDPSCEELLTEVEFFLLGHLQNQPSGGEGDEQASATPAPTPELTPEATAATNG